MTERARQLIDDFNARGWESKPYDAFLELLRDAPQEVPELVLQCIRELERGATFFDHALSFLDEAQFDAAIDLALQRLTAAGAPPDDSTPAVAVVEHASLQLPHLLRPHLRALWDLRPSGGSYSAPWPWRAADAGERARLLSLLDTADARDGEMAAQALLQTRDRETVMRVLATRWAAQLDTRDFLLGDVGLALGGDGELRALGAPACLHLVLGPGLLEERAQGAPHLRPDMHPTWGGLGAPVASATLGGTVASRCGICGQQQHRLLDIPAVPDGLGVGLRRLELVTCLSCLGWEEGAGLLFQRHDAAGRAEPLTRRDATQEPQFAAKPLLAGEVGLVTTPARWCMQDWAWSNGRENLHRLGGTPSWIQNAAYPRCPGCARSMTALLQLDSGLPTQDGGEWLWGSGGMAYTSWCDGCAISATQWQCT